MDKLIISLLGLPASGKNFYGEQLATKHGFKFIKEPATELIFEQKFQIGINASFEFDNILLMRNRKLVNEIMNSKEKVIIVEGGPLLDMLYLEGRMNFGKHKEQRKRLIEAYADPLFKSFMKDCRFVLFNISPEISLSRQEERNIPELATLESELLEFVHQNLVRLARENGEKATVINMMGRTKEEIFQEFETKIFSLRKLKSL